MRWPATARRRWRPGVTNTTPSRGRFRACSARSRPCSAGQPRPGGNPMADRPGDTMGFATARRTFYVLGSVALVVAALYWGQPIFVPLALAVLLTLLLSPVVSRLERRGLRRHSAVLSVAGLAFLLIGLAGWAVAAQVTSLLADLPQHRADIRAKLAQLRQSAKRSPFKPLQELVDEVSTEGEPTDPASGAAPVVRVEAAKPSLLGQFRLVAGQVLGGVSLA